MRGCRERREVQGWRRSRKKRERRPTRRGAPGDRFEQHRAGYRSSKYPRKYGIELAQDLIEGFDGDGLDDAEKEAALAEWLRGQGFAVWQK